MPHNLWFDVPPGRIRSTPVRLGGTNLAIDGDDVWLIDSLVWDDDHDPVTDHDQVVAAMGATIAAAAYVASLRRAHLPGALEEGSAARNVPADHIGPGRPTLITIDGQVQLAAYWDYPPLRATYAITQHGHLGILAPMDVAPVILRTVPELPEV